MDIEQIRSQIKAKRLALEEAEVSCLSQRIAARIMRTEVFKQAHHIAYYLPVAGEADPTWLLTPEFIETKAFYLPIIKQEGKIGLNFSRVDDQTRLQENQYGIPEPVPGEGDRIEPEQLDLVITPLVSFDREHNRIGMGGGFYDRTFAFKRESTHLKAVTRPLLIGYAYEFQRSEALMPEYWDVKLDGIVTEEEAYF